MNDCSSFSGRRFRRCGRRLGSCRTKMIAWLSMPRGWPSVIPRLSESVRFRRRFAWRNDGLRNRPACETAGRGAYRKLPNAAGSERFFACSRTSLAGRAHRRVLRWQNLFPCRCCEHSACLHRRNASFARRCFPRWIPASCTGPSRPY